MVFNLTWQWLNVKCKGVELTETEEKLCDYQKGKFQQCIQSETRQSGIFSLQTHLFTDMQDMSFNGIRNSKLIVLCKWFCHFLVGGLLAKELKVQFKKWSKKERRNHMAHELRLWLVYLQIYLMQYFNSLWKGLYIHKSIYSLFKKLGMRPNSINCVYVHNVENRTQLPIFYKNNQFD